MGLVPSLQCLVAETWRCLLGFPSLSFLSPFGLHPSFRAQSRCLRTLFAYLTLGQVAIRCPFSSHPRHLPSSQEFLLASLKLLHPALLPLLLVPPVLLSLLSPVHALLQDLGLPEVDDSLIHLVQGGTLLL